MTISKRKKETATYITIIQIFVSKASIRSTRKELRNRWTRDFGMVACERGISCFSCRRAKKEEKRGKSEGRRSGDRFCGPCQVPAPRGKWQRKIFSGSVSSRGGSRDLGSRVERSNNDSPILAIGIVRRLDCLNISRIEGTYIRVRGRFPRYRINLNRIFSMNKRISWNLTGKRKRKRGEIVNSRAPFFSIRESKK